MAKNNDDTLLKTNSKYKIAIPIENELCESALTKILKINKYPIYIQRLQRLVVHKQLMRNIKSNVKTVIEVEEWVNKLIGRVTIRIKKIDYDGVELTLSEGGFIYFKGIEDLEVLFPWADFSLYEEYYEESDHDMFVANYVEHPPFSFGEYRDHLPELRSIELNGEVSFYRFEMSLNNIGKSFLKLNKYLEGGQQTKLRLTRNLETKF